MDYSNYFERDKTLPAEEKSAERKKAATRNPMFRLYLCCKNIQKTLILISLMQVVGFELVGVILLCNCQDPIFFCWGDVF